MLLEGYLPGAPLKLTKGHFTQVLAHLDWIH
jgi:hypothetical protein